MARAGASALLAMLLALELAACGHAEPEAAVGSSLLPGLSAREDQVDALRLRGAGNKPLVTLHRVGRQWLLAERNDWPADGGHVAQYLAQLAQARRAEAKTDREVMYVRLGVEDLRDPEAGGTELSLSGHGFANRLLIGKEHKLSGGRYVRVDGEKRAWLSDVDIGFDPDPVAWMDRRVVEVPLARVERVRIRPRIGGAFSLVNLDDRFRPDDAPPAAMHDSHAGDAIASALESFEIEEVAEDLAHTPASRELDYELVDGAVLTVAVWRDGQRDWARLSSSLDQVRAAAWSAQARNPGIAGAAQARVRSWNQRFAGRRFLLPTALASTLMLEHFQILQGTPDEVAP